MSYNLHHISFKLQRCSIRFVSYVLNLIICSKLTNVLLFTVEAEAEGERRHEHTDQLPRNGESKLYGKSEISHQRGCAAVVPIDSRHAPVGARAERSMLD